MSTSTLTGTATLARLVLRRDRVRLAVWVVLVSLLVLAQAQSIESLYPTTRSLEEAAATMGGDPAFVAMAGPARALDTLGGRITWEIVLFAAVLAGLMNVFAVTRHTRADEEAGRAELVRSAAVGRHAAIAATLVVLVAADVVLAIGVAGAVFAVGPGLAGSAALGAGVGATGLVFAAVALVTAQVTEGGRAANGLAGAALGAAYVLRAVGDIGEGWTSWLSWVSPLAWPQQLRPFAGERWWVLALALATVAALVAVAVALASRRDVGAGLVAARPGPAVAAPGLLSPRGLALRLQRGGLVAWTVAAFLGGLAYGSVGRSVDDIVGDNEAMRDIVAQAGGDLTDSFFATTVLVLALIGGGFAVQSALRPRGEETAGRAEPLLATAVSRGAWAGGHLLVALAGTVLVLAAAGAGTGLSYGIAVGDAGQVPRLVGASLAYVPAVWVLAGVAAALAGIVPRAAVAAWAFLGACAALAILGEVLDVPGAVRDLSPFSHVPPVPAASVSALPLVALTAAAAVLVAAGLAGLRRRDVG